MIGSTMQRNCLSDRAARARPVTNFPDHLLCLLCKQPLFSGNSTPEGARFCQECACQDCSPDRGTRRDILIVKAYCPNELSGCQAELKYAEIDTHLAGGCDFERIECPRCSEMIAQYKLHGSHSDILSEACCPSFKGPCHICHLADLSRAEFIEHQEKCHKSEFDRQKRLSLLEAEARQRDLLVAEMRENQDARNAQMECKLQAEARQRDLQVAEMREDQEARYARIKFYLLAAVYIIIACALPICAVFASRFVEMNSSVSHLSADVFQLVNTVKFARLEKLVPDLKSLVLQQENDAKSQRANIATVRKTLSYLNTKVLKQENEAMSQQETIAKLEKSVSDLRKNEIEAKSHQESNKKLEKVIFDLKTKVLQQETENVRLAKLVSDLNKKVLEQESKAKLHLFNIENLLNTVSDLKKMNAAKSQQAEHEKITKPVSGVNSKENEVKSQQAEHVKITKPVSGVNSKNNEAKSTDGSNIGNLSEGSLNELVTSQKVIRSRSF